MAQPISGSDQLDNAVKFWLQDHRKRLLFYQEAQQLVIKLLFRFLNLYNFVIICMFGVQVDFPEVLKQSLRSESSL